MIAGIVLADAIKSDLTQALKSQDSVKISTLRMLMAALKEKEISLRTDGTAAPLTDEQVLGVITKQVKQRKESITEYEKAGRIDLANKEKEELAVLESYLPEQMDASEIRRLVEKGVAEVEAQSIKDMGKVMGQVMPQVRGRAEGGEVNRIVKEVLGG